MTDQVQDPSRRRPFWHLLVGFAVIVTALGLLGGWPLPFVIFAIILMIIFHELGHFVTARLTGMKASEFFVGFGPRLWSRQRGETEYGVKAILLGGYVKIIGMSSLEEIDPADESQTFRVSTYPRKVLVASAGSLMHGLLALLLVWASLTFFGNQTSSKVSITGLSTFSNVATTPARLAGFHRGDQIVRINGHRITSDTGFISDVQHSVGKSLSFVVLRHGHLVTLHATPLDGRKLFEPGSTSPLAKPNGPAVGYIGVGLETTPVLTRETPWAAVPGSFNYVGRIAWATTINIGKIFSPSGIGGLFHLVTNNKAAQQSSTNPGQGAVRPTSIYGAGRYAYQLAKVDPSALLLLFAAINIGIGFVNMLPMLPLDGGHVAVATYERLRTRRGSARYVADVNKLLPVAYAFLALLLVIFGSALYLDIAHPINF